MNAYTELGFRVLTEGPGFWAKVALTIVILAVAAVTVNRLSESN